jgi:hypothetical protein
VAKPRPEYDPDYLIRKAQLPKDLAGELSLIEEQILSDPTREHQRTYGSDGVIVDASGLDQWGIEVSYLPLEDGSVFLFLGFTVEPF